MVFNLWSILLIASASQCVFLIVLFLIRPPANKKALVALLLLLLVILSITVNNIWYASYLYRSIQTIAGFTRGMTLLLGPLFFLYAQTIVLENFKYKWIHLLHLIPYFLAWVLITEQNRGAPAMDPVELLDSFLAYGRPANTLFIVRYILYVLHLLVYFALARRQMKLSFESSTINLLIPTKTRVQWLNRLTWLLVIIAASQAFFIIKASQTGLYDISSNYALTMVTSLFVYMTAYQAILDNKSLLPGFDTKQESVTIDENKKAYLISKLDSLFTEQKLFRNANLKASDVARELDIPFHVLSKLLNSHLNKTFFEFLNHYRIREFIRISNQPEYSNYSIMGLASEVGYKSKSSFNTAFKKQMGQTPSDYIKSLKS